MTTQTADELKQSGNKAFSSGNYADAVDLFSRAIDASSPSDQQHVLFSNRSAAYAASKSNNKNNNNWYVLNFFVFINS